MGTLSTAIKLQRTFYKIQKLWVKLLGTSGQIYFEDRAKQYEGIWKTIADELGASFTALDDDLWQIELNGARVRLLNYKLPMDNPVVLGLAGRKPVVHQLLKNQNIPIPEYTSFRLNELNIAYDFLQRFPLSCVVKPAGGYGGKGVTTHITNKRQLKNAAILASLQSGKLLIEQQVVGECYRLLVVDGKYVHAVRRNGYRLTGDGRSSLKQLLDPADNLKIDKDCIFTMAAQGVNWDTVPKVNQSILIKSIGKDDQNTSELRTVYDEVVTSEVCDAIIKDAEDSAKITGSNFLGVDIITTDIGKDLRSTGGTVNEVNTTPALHHHYNSQKEKYPLPALNIVRNLLQKK